MSSSAIKDILIHMFLLEAEISHKTHYYMTQDIYTDDAQWPARKPGYSGIIQRGLKGLHRDDHAEILLKIKSPL